MVFALISVVNITSLFLRSLKPFSSLLFSCFDFRIFPTGGWRKKEEGSEEVVEGKAEIVCFLGKWSGSLTFAWAGPDHSRSGLSCRPKIGLASICSSLVCRISFF